MADVMERYRTVRYELPDRNVKWSLYGAGLEKLGREGRPVVETLPAIGDDEVLMRVDAVGLCFSDIKLINAGPDHPRIEGRNLKEDPTVPGHEVAMTVIEAGKKRKDTFHPGERYLIQADIHYQGIGLAFGYALEGGLQQYCVVGREVIDGDDGCYLLPVEPGDGYAEVALSEPWACVEAAYRIRYRDHLKPGGRLWMVKVQGGEGLARDLAGELGGALSSSTAPREVLLSGFDRGEQEMMGNLARKCGFELGAGEDMIDRPGDPGEYDAIIVLGPPDPEFVERASAELNREGVFCVLASDPPKRPVEIDIGRVHYDAILYTGSSRGSLEEAFGGNDNFELTAGGRVLIIGAGGPMGQMHVQRAVSRPDGPRLVVATEIDSERLDVVEESFGSLAAENGVDLKLINPREVGEEENDRLLESLSEGKNFTEVVVMAPVPAIVEQASSWLAEGGVLNIFAGIPRGRTARLDLGGCYLRGQRWVGSSGSSISDLRYTLGKTQRGELDPNRSVAAIGGMNAVREGLQAVSEGLLPGKIVIFPQIEDLPLLPLPDLARELPDVARKLEDGHWTPGAEEALLEAMLDL